MVFSFDFIHPIMAFFARCANEICVFVRLIYDNKIKAIRGKSGKAIDRKHRAIKFERRL